MPHRVGRARCGRRRAGQGSWGKARGLYLAYVVELVVPTGVGRSCGRGGLDPARGRWSAVHRERRVSKDALLGWGYSRTSERVVGAETSIQPRGGDGSGWGEGPRTTG